MSARAHAPHGRRPARGGRRTGAPRSLDVSATGLLFEHPSSREYDQREHVADHPDTPERIEAIDAALAAIDWLGWERRRRTGGDASRARGCACPGADRPHGAIVRGRWRTDRRRNVRRPGLLQRRAARQRRRLRNGARAGGRRGARRLRAASPAGTPRRALPRDGLLPVQQHRRGRPARDRRARCAARADHRLGRAPRQRHRRDLPLPKRRALREHPPGRHLPRHRPARRRRLRRRPWLHAQPTRRRWYRGRGVALTARARCAASGDPVCAGARADLGRLRRAPRRPARWLPA